MGTSDFDDILVRLGMGRWNLVYIIAAAYSCFLTPPQFLSGVYMVPHVEYTCLVPENETTVELSSDSCSYLRNSSDTEERIPCTKWSFNNSLFTSSITSEFGLACDHDYQRANYQAAYMFGTLLGQYIGGYLADRYGRKIVVVVTHVLMSITAIGMVFLNSFITILIFRFINGAVYLLMPFILSMEVCTPKYRAAVGVLAGMPWALGTIFWGSAAYFVRDWRYLQLTVSLPSLLIFIPLYLMDESPRWLIVEGYHTKALKVLKKAAKWNRATLPSDEELLKLFKDIENQTVSNISKQNEESPNQEAKKSKSCGRPKLFSTPQISIITTVLCWSFFTVSLVFDGLNLSGDIYSADPFLYIILGGLVEVPGYTLSVPVIERFGRKIPTAVNYFFCGVVILVVIIIPANITWLVMTLVLLGKLFITAAYQIIYVYSTELFPTEVRSQGMGLACVCQQAGSVLSPYITTYIGPLCPWVPSVLFGGASLLSGMTTLKLGETLNIPLPDTVADLENVNRRRKEKHGEVTSDIICQTELKSDCDF
ncbi:organic cation transporter protein-like isoform X1 [Macrobrachium nipponense]|uniref:organic cation transporter protein-like isoform X1 n=1 Tax=Macrobrachium nipponense TaxID=159736 RepID=UPI0030C7E2C7